ncbi:MAG TPA: SIMPL domain-containing protein [Gemmatimonadales bacterium]|nr:SIMPL domain-containing protein [Gemmatimonadales bacterium]
MVRIGVAVLGAMVAVIPPAIEAQAAAPEPQPPPFITVTATESVTVPPDYAALYITVRARDSDAGRAGEQHAATATRVRAALEALGYPRDSLPTVAYRVTPEYDPQRGRPVAYSAMSTVRVHVHDLARVGRVIDTALAAGANGIDRLTYASTASEAARLNAIAKAVEAARREAEAIARAAGGRLGALLEANSGGMVTPMYEAGIQMRAAGGETPIEPGDIQVSATVTTRWAFVSQR